MSGYSLVSVGVLIPSAEDVASRRTSEDLCVVPMQGKLLLGRTFLMTGDLFEYSLFEQAVESLRDVLGRDKTLYIAVNNS